MAEAQIRVLLIEDDKILSDILVKQFASRRAVVVQSTTGREALDALQNDGQFDVILLDISLPDIDGFEVLSQIQLIESLKEIPVIIISNFAQEKDIEWGRKLGAKQFIKKVSVMPIDIIDAAFKICEDSVLQRSASENSHTL